MKVKCQLPLGLGFVLGSSLLLSGALPAQAQTGNQSDVTGAIITTGDIAGGAFAPAGGGGGIVTNTAIESNVNQAANSVSAQLAGGTLPVVATNVPNASIPAAVLQSLQSVLTTAGNVATSSNQIASALTNASGTSNPTLAQNLVTSLQGLTANGTPYSPALVAAVAGNNFVADVSGAELLPSSIAAISTAPGIAIGSASFVNPGVTLALAPTSSFPGLAIAATVAPANLAAAVEAYNALIDASSGAFLTSPPPELLAIQSVLSALVNAAVEGE